jgi:hypothetical protein
MSGRDLNGAYLTELERRLDNTARRRELAKAGRCINGPIENRPGKRHGVVHGPVVPGTGKCQRCIDVAKRSR